MSSFYRNTEMHGMLREQSARPTSVPTSVEGLLLEAFERRGVVLPPMEPVLPGSMPEPFQSLLVHDSDMTSTLQRFYRDRLRLQRLSSRQTEDRIEREVLLSTELTSQPVEYGVISIHLNGLGLPAQRLIQEGRIPLGQLLEDCAVRYSSQPQGFFRIGRVAFMEELLHDAPAAVRYGRLNVLSTESGEVLAEVIEILTAREFDKRC